MSSLAHRKALFAAVVIVILGAVAIARVISAKRSSPKTYPQTVIKQRVERETGEMKAAADAAAGDVKTASPTRDSNSPSSVPVSAPPQPVASPAESGGTALSPSPAAAAPIVPVARTGDQARDWALKYERTENGPEADFVVRTGDINNLGFGWPAGFDPFSGKSTPVHRFPWTPPPNEPDGTDRILLGSAVDPTEELRDPVAYNRLGSDGYSKF
jgi:hypothetical protein